MNSPKKSLSDRRILIILAFISAFPPLSTDLYLPALPRLVELFETSPSKINLTLSLFFWFFAVGILIWGPLSDKYGRKPILYIGLSIYIVASLFCAASQTYLQLILARIFQAFGGGAATAVATAMVKDLYDGKKRARVLAVIMAMVITAPVVAPIIGALLLKIASWRAIFLALSGFGFISFLMALPLEESLKIPYQGPVLSSLGRLFVVLKNPGFTSLLAVFSNVTMPLMGFIAASSYIYIQGFGLNEQVYSLYFSANAVGALMGPILYIRLSGYFKPGTIITACFSVMAASGILVVYFGPSSPLVFLATMIPATVSVTLIRPPSASLLLEQQQQDTGSASSLINFFVMMMGGVGMSVVSLGTGHLIVFLGILQIAVGSLGFISWHLLKNRSFIVQID